MRYMLLLGALFASVVHADEPTPMPKPERLAAIDRVVQQGIDRGDIPGAVVLIKHQGHDIYLRAFGDRTIEPHRKPLQTDTVFDLASLTKPVCTATCIHVLIEEGRLTLDDPVSRWIPEFAQNGKEAVTVRHLLIHQSGLIPDNSMADYADGKVVAFERIHALPVRSEPGTKFAYSDVGFLVLGELVERISGETLDVFAQRRIFGPAGMTDTTFNPNDELRARIAPTEKRNGAWMQGDVHDPRAYALGGVAGHAGLFSTAPDLGRFGELLLQRGVARNQQVLKTETVDRMFAPEKVSSGLRSLGWDKDSPYSANRGDLLSPAAIGHGGFTGTALWIDPEQQLVIVVLSSRLYPDGEGSVNTLAGRIATIAAAALP